MPTGTGRHGPQACSYSQSCCCSTLAHGRCWRPERHTRPKMMGTLEHSTLSGLPAVVPGNTAPGVAPKLKISRLNFFYGRYQALHDVELAITGNRITALIGPSGCGKSTFLRVLNRMYETVRGARVSGEVLLDGEDALAMDVAQLRRRVGMVFQKPNPFPKSIFENVAYGLRVNRTSSKVRLNEAVEHSLKRAALWDEVKDKLHNSA